MLKNIKQVLASSIIQTSSLQRMLLFLICFGLSSTVFGQVDKYPADINPMLGQPYSLYFSDYSTPGGNTLKANIVFNDFNEPVWNFKLRIKIESADLRLETVPGYTPPAPITLSPGVIKTISGDEWANYFNYNNLSVSGVSLNELIRTGRLPEGFYSFCFQVLDYDTGDPLSEEVCTTAWLKLKDPPRLSLPLCGNSVDPKLTQIPFSWQLFDAVSPNAQQETQFQLTIWEITEKGAPYQSAVANGQALQVFQSPLLSEPVYAYGPADPPLEIGKEYVYRIQAIDPGGKDRFKNQGYSEFCHFYYGWPIDGNIALKFPKEGDGFRKKDIPYLQWKPVDTQLPGQQVSYEIKVTPMEEEQAPETAILQNQPWYQYTTPESPVNYDRGQQIDQTLDVMTKYAWQVKAYTDQQEVGKSEVSYFNGPTLMENFWAGNHRVAVDYLDGTDLNDMSGGGRIRFKADPNAWTDIRFEHIQLEDAGEFYIMTGGEFYYEPHNLTIALPADYERNGEAYFDIERFRVNKEGIYAEGAVRWPFPFATLSSQVAQVKSKKLWVNYNNFTINAVAALAKGNTFDLLEPFDFTVKLDESALIYIYNNQFRFDLNGEVDFPDAINGTTNSRIGFTFRDIEQLFYVEQASKEGYAHILPFANANVEVITKKYTLDLSEKESPDKFRDNLMWKGVYLKDFDLKLNRSIDQKGQFDMTGDMVKNMVQPATDEMDAWITTAGLNLKFDASFEGEDNMVFQTFPSRIRQFKLQVDESQVVADQSLIKGDFIIPVISTEDRFHFTIPVNNLGFQDGFLEDVAGTKFTFNKGSGDQEIKIDIKRAVLSGYEKIAMTIDLEWPSMGVMLENLRGFRAWGDYNIGFDNKNGTVPLTRRYNASLSGYPVTIDVIGAGSNNGHYSFATTADAGLGDDVSGGEGAPKVNVYSIVENKYVPADAAGQIAENTTDQISFEDASQNATQNYEELEQQLTESLKADQEQLIAEAEDLQNSVADGMQGEIYEVEDIVQSDENEFPSETGYGAETIEGSEYNSRQQEIVYEIAAGFVEEMAKPLLKPIQDKTDSLNLIIATKVNGIVSDVDAKVKTNVENIVNELAHNMIDALQNDKVDVSGPINEMASATSERITLEITSSLQQTIDNNILGPVSVLLKDKITGRINQHITVNGTKAVYSVLTGQNDNAEDALKEVVAGLPQVLNAAVRDVAGFVSIDNIQSTVESTASDFVRNINMSEVGHDLRVAAEQVLKDAVNDKLNEAISGLAEDYAEDLGLGGFGIGGENPIDFVGVADRLKEGDIKGVFAVDPVRVKLRTPVIDLDGFMSYTPQHEVYGDVWVGDIDMTIKVPKKFAFNAIYFNGRKDGVSYWFCQITPPGGNDEPYQLGKPIPKTAKPLEKPVDIGIAKIVGASGRLYHHMSETPNGAIVPDAAMKYGAYMHFVFFDKNTNGKNLRLEVSGEINSAENGDYTIAFDGNLQTRSNSPEVMEIDKTAVVQGTVMIRYNSAEEHFLGYAKVVVNKPGSLCAQGSLLVDVKPGKWRVAIGSREERIIFVPGCSGWSPTGWLDVNQEVAEIGLGLQYSGRAESPTIPLGFVKVKAGVDAGIAAGIVAAVRYNPSFALVKAGVWIDMWAYVYMNYKFPLKKWKSITLVDIFIRGDLVMIFEPPPTILEGKLDGRVKILFFRVNFKAEMRKEL